MLVVLAIIAIASGAVVLGMGTGRDAGEAEARRLATRLALAADMAMTDDRPLGFAWDAHGYRFLRWGGAGWEPAGEDALEPHDLPRDLTLAAPGTNPLVIGADEGGAPLDLALAGRRRGWTVRFDGVAAQVAPGGAH